MTNVIPTLNDDDEQLTGIANWIRLLGELTPARDPLYPQYNLSDKPATPFATLDPALQIGKKAGLRFIYVGTVPGHDGENTVCYNCGNLNISRRGYATRVVGLDGQACKFCGADLNMRVTTKSCAQPECK